VNWWSHKFIVYVFVLTSHIDARLKERECPEILLSGYPTADSNEMFLQSN
jgi:hypothetical protein